MPHSVVEPSSRSNPVLAACLLFLFLGTARVSGGELDARHGGPLIGLFGVPGAPESLPLPNGVQRRFEFLLQGSSHSVSAIAGDEQLLLDGETWRAALRFRTRVGGHLELGMEVPWLRNTAGSLDGLIDDWHALFGLPDGIRDQRPTDELLYRYRNDVGDEFAFRSGASGLGDIRLTAGWALRRVADGSLSLHAAVELPTGDADELTGNGSTDYSVGLGWRHDALDRYARWSAFVTTGVVRFGTLDLAAIDTRDWGGWLHAGIGWRIAPRVELLAQFQAASSPLDSGLDDWGSESLMIGLGAGFEIARYYRLEIGFTEDIDVESAPDISFLLRLSRR